MCTVTYTPLSGGGFVLASNRDENTLRAAAQPPQHYMRNGQKLVFPRDPQGQGSWFVAAENGMVVCLLNGAETAHVPQPPYKHSRGLVPLHFVGFDSAADFVAHYNFEGIEPFTLVMASVQNVYQIRWNGSQASLTELGTSQPHIWSSATLYSPQTIEKRKLWFEKWLAQIGDCLNENPKYITDFHRFAGDGDIENSVLMNRSGVLKTVSISTVVHRRGQTAMYYLDLATATESLARLPLEKETTKNHC